MKGVRVNLFNCQLPHTFFNLKWLLGIAPPELTGFWFQRVKQTLFRPGQPSFPAGEMNYNLVLVTNITHQTDIPYES